MKSYTDLEQSKMLAEILSLESADMGWNVFIDETTRILPIDDWDLVKNGSGNVKFYPAWSISALLNVLPIVYTNNKKEVCGPIHIDITDSETPFVLWYVNPSHKGSIVELQTNEYNNLVDACYEMILELKKRNLI